ncbi:MAG TPA: hypothetical protein VGH39_00845, partial [Xanthobacteraceae bacterium]
MKEPLTMGIFHNPIGRNRNCDGSGCACGRHDGRTAHAAGAVARATGDSQEERYKHAAVSAIMCAVFPK